MVKGSTGKKRQYTSPRKREQKTLTDKILRWASGALLAGLMAMSSWTLSTLLEIRDMARSNRQILGMNDITIAEIKEDVKSIKKELQTAKMSNTEMRMFKMISDIENKLNRIR